MFLIGFIALFALFLANVVLGKAQLIYGWQLPFLLGDLAEFLLLLVTAVFFTLAILRRERLASDRDGAGSESRPERD